jgi:serine/threonine protein kinase/Tol biopolymer transport system component
MAIESGTRLGPYEILAAIGAGGMGEIYRARDTRLDRTVAVKVLSDALASDPQLRERFEREARAISALNHPHICALYDVGEAAADSAGRGQPTQFLVLEYLEGQTLAQKLTAGPLGLTDALRYATEIADALDKAHRAGIVHRDLKPANVMITKAGAKLLDFGLAKSAAPVVATSGLSMLPTTPPALTQQGTILGTFQYMAPEQIEGLEADARTDIFAFGALLFEMLTGRTAFEGKTRASLLGAILKDDPPRASSLAPGAPTALDRLLSTCLAKDPDDRYQSARDLHRDLRWAVSPEALAPTAVASPPRPGRSGRAAWMLAAAAMAGFAVVSIVAIRHLRETAPVLPTVEFTIPVPDQHMFGGPPGGGTGSATQLAVSPDGHHVAFVTRKDARFQLWLRSIDSVTARPLPGTDGAAFPFWSPDGRSIGFFADGKLKKMQIGAGTAITLCDAGGGRGATWSPDGSTIIFAPSGVGPLMRVPSAGGAPTVASALDRSYGESNHRYPHFLPDGQHYLFTAVTGPSGAALRPTRIKIGTLASTDSGMLLETESSAVYAMGHVFFHRDGTLMAQPFNADSRTLGGEPFPIVGDIGVEGSRYASFSASGAGTLAHAAGGRLGAQLTWRDRAGKAIGTVGEVALYSSVALSPDEKRLAVAITTGNPQNRDIWTIDLGRNVVSRLTFDPGDDGGGVWSPDGSRIVFSSMRPPDFGIRTITAGATGGDELIFKGDRPVPHFSTDWSRDGRHVAYVEGAPPVTDIWVLPMNGDRKPMAFARTAFVEDAPSFSPDSRWIAYSSNESGAMQVYVQPFPPTGRKYIVSQNGGSQPQWRADGRELYFLAPDSTLHAASVTIGAQFESGIPERLFVAPIATAVGGRRQYAVTGDGKRFLFIAPPAADESTPITVLTNWRPPGR